MSKRGRLKKKYIVDVPSDLITELPRHVIDVIMERVPLYDAARMSVLSRKWFDIWRSIPKLAFDAKFFKRVFRRKVINTHQFYHIVSKILFHHSGQLIRFHLDIPDLTSQPDVSQWICYLSRNGVSDICIQNQCLMPPKLSSDIFSCGNLENLKLQSCTINPPHDYEGFRKMTCLELDSTVLSAKAFKSLIRGCPLLQELRLTNFIDMEHVTIDAPNLSRLIVDGTFKSLDVRNAEKLESAVIGLQKCVDVSLKASLGVLIQSLASSSKLQKLVFRGHFVKAIYQMFMPPPTFEKLKNLELSSIHLNEVDEFSSIISIIQSCPAIERLNISVTTSKQETSHMLVYDPCIVLQCLRYANVEICRGSNMELKLIEFLLKCSPILKKISITASASIGSTFTPEVMHQLVCFRRASQNVEVSCPNPAVSVYPVSSDSDWVCDCGSYSDSD
ncbi:F-box/FBD/LRR-repeat protein At1g13570-like [Silene latifolia]|uniref:F-box/FBD/LRR-repeat protein At1g13570-like n=1 Tax=Silene latifolia TaxID=37657 RepID=UPI003D779242